jgi:hypothetical protein
MVAESDLRPGVIIQAEEQMYRVLTAEYRAGGGKMPGPFMLDCKMSSVDRSPTGVSGPKRSS